ncbi:YadA-like family protein [uncultured Psychrobacter sp.]|uniref:YadA-like family protein n=1 Tax=uncultured Psychrobacter sp. TaxID=259303 RepID=UPI0034591C65
MNRNYKVIWNQSLNCFMAVAEYAKSRGKSSSTTVTSDSSSTFNDTVTGGAQLLRLSALCIGLASAGFSMQAVAVVGPNSIDTNVCDATSNPSTAANKSTGDIAIGCNSDASGRNNIAIGGTATTKANAGATQGAQSIAIGYDAQTKGDQSIGFGANVRANGSSSIAIGGDDLDSASKRNTDGTSNAALNSGDVNQAFRKFAGRDLVYTDANGASNPNIPDVNRRQYIGTETAGPASVAVGVQAQSVGALSTAFGTQATSIGVGSAAFGVSATATKAGSVALGAGAETDKNATSEKTVVIGGKTYNFAGSVLDGAGGPVKTGAQVSVGATGLERQIKNVAGGRIDSSSTDAINGSQLAATNSALEDTNNNVTANTGRINTNANNITGNTNNIANLTNGRAGIVRQDNGTAPITVGSNTGGNSVNFTGTSGRRTLTGLANGNVATGSTDAITGDQLSATNITVANVQTAADNAQTTANTANTTANSALTQANLGFGIAADNGTANNVQLGEAVTFTNTDNNLVATVSDNAINYGLADDISVNQLTVGDATNDTVLTSTANGLDVGGDKITNIVDGTIAAGSTEAVTGNQLNATNTNVNTNANNIATNTSNIATNTSDIIDNRNVSQGNVTALGGGASYNAATDTYTAPTYSLNNDTDSFNNVDDALGNLDTRTTANTGDIATNAGNINTNANNITGNTGSIADLTNGRAGIVRQDAGTGAITVGATTGGNSIDLTGSNGARTLTGLANGNVVAGSTDAITGDQLNTTNTNVATAQTAADNAQGSADNAQTTANTALSRADLGFGIAADNGTANNIQPGEVVTFTNNDGNLVATVSDNAINYDLADDISVTQLTVGDGTNNTVLTSTANGLDVGGAKITNVADGTIAAGSTEAVTGNQLNATNANVTTNANNIATNTGNITTNTSNIATNTSNITDNRNASQGNVTALGGGASYNAATDTYTAPTYTLDDGTNAGVTTNVNNVGDALDNLDTRTTTNAGNINTNANNIAGNTGSIADLTNGRTGIVRQDTGTGAISVGAQTGGTSIDFTGTDGVRILTGLANGNVAADSTDTITGDQLNTTNINVTTNANSITANITDITDNRNASQGNVTALGGGAEYNAATDTYTAPKYTVFTNPGDATGTSSTVNNVGDAISAINTAVQTPLTFAADSGTIERQLGDTFNISGDNGNITTAATATGIEVQMSATPTFDTVTVNNAPTAGTDVTNKDYVDGSRTSVTSSNSSISVIETADGNARSFDLAVNAQALSDSAQLPVVYTTTDGTRLYKQADGSFNTVANGSGSTVAVDNILASVQAADGSTTTPTVLSNIADGELSTTSTDAINGSQLNATNTNVTTNTGNIATNTGNITTNTGDIANLTNGRTGIVRQDAGTGAITIGNSTSGTSVDLNGTDGVRTLTGLANGNVATGSSDAITGDQLNTTNNNVTTNANDITDNRNASQGNVTALGGNAGYDAATDTYTPPAYTLDDGTGTDTTVNNVGDALGNLNTRTAANTADITTNAGNINTNANNIAGNTGSIADLANGRTGIVRQDAGTGAITVGAQTGGTSIDIAGTDGVRTLTGLANGNVAAGSTDAITGEQLNASAEALSTIVGGNAVNTGGVITATNIGGTGVDNIDEAITSVNDTAIKAKSTVSEGDNIVIATTTNADGSTNYQVATANNLVLDSLTTGNTVTNNSGVTINDGANVTTLSSAGNTVTDGSNTSNYSANGFTTNDNAGNSVMVNQTGLSFNNSAGATGPSISATGINAGSIKISNLEAGTLATDAVNKGQLDAITGNIAAGGVQYDRNADDTVNYDNVSFAGTPAIIGTDENGNNVVVSGGTTLTNVANGVNAADAVNKGQLDSIIANNITDVEVTDQDGNVITTVNVAQQVVNSQPDNANTDSLFLTYDVAGQEVTDRLSIGQTVQKMNTEGVKFAHTNAVNATSNLGNTNDSSAGADNSTAIGVNAIVAADAESTIALGHNTLASDNATNAVVIGKDSQVGGASSIAIGNGSQANGNQSISVGTRNIVNGNNSGAFGDPTIINGDNSYSVGNNNAIDSSDTFVLGNNVTQSVDGSVVLGTGSAATTGAGITGYRADTSDANDAILATTSSTGAVAVGDADNDIYRQVTGVAAGTADSDAVNVAQLRAVDTTLSNLVTGNIGLVQQAGNQNVITIGAATGGTSINVAGTDGNRQIAGVAAGTANTDALNVGQLGSVLGGNTTVADNGQINANLNVGGNQYNTVQDALTAVNTQTGQLNDAAVQYDRDANGSVNQNQITLGGGAEGTLITNVQNGNVATGSRDAINGGQLNDTADSIAGVIGGNATNTGGVITATNIGGTGASTIDGAISSIQQNNASTNAAVSNNTANIASNSSDIQDNTGRLNAGLNFSADSGATINQPIGDNSAISFVGGDNITTTASDSGIQFDLNGNINVDTVSAQSITTGNTTVNNSGVTIQNGPSMTTNGINAGGSVVTGVADGIDATDAVNFGQLSALDRRLNSNVSELGYKINEVEDEANAGISAAMAMSSLPQAYIPGKSMVGGGIASYNGESAVAVGVSKVSDNGRWVIKANGTADTQGNAGGAIGAGFHF